MENKINIKEINEKIEKESAFIDLLLFELNKVIVGQKSMIERLLIGLLGKGHILLEGVPGLAKTLVINSLSQAIKGSFSRIQFTPDLLPADVVGTQIYNIKETKFSVKKGPIFANFVLADEINRAPSKVQSALLEAMQERQVTIGEETYKLDAPFLVLATQNPIEQEGTYPLPEAQIDRFMMKLVVDYPKKEEERLILRQAAKTNAKIDIKPSIKAKDILKAQLTINDIYVDEKVEDYVLNLVFATRNPDQYNLGDISQLIEFGASPRATINLILASKARAFLEHRGYITPEDVRFVGKDILRHRIILTYEAEAEELTSEDIIQRLFDSIEIP